MNGSYIASDTVELLDIVNGKVALIIGTVQKVVPFDDYDYLLIKGSTLTGIPIECRTFTDNKSLKHIKHKFLHQR